MTEGESHRLDGSDRPALNRREFVATAVAVPAAFVFQPGEADRTPNVECLLYPALPDGVASLAKSPWTAKLGAEEAVLENAFARFRIALASGLLLSVLNKITGEEFAFSDELGLDMRDAQGGVSHFPPDGPALALRPAHEASDSGGIQLTLTGAIGDGVVRVSYRGAPGAFWLERRLVLEPGVRGVRLERVLYGRFSASPGQTKVLELGKFDRPRLLSGAKGGVFGGVGWWFYQTSADGTYENREMGLAVNERFESEPWYVGVFRREEGEPYPGWLWYRSFLQLQKSAEDRQETWCYWNAGWGQWGIDVDDPSAEKYIDLARRLGISSIAFGSGGSGKGVPAYVELMKVSEAAKANAASLKRANIEFGFLEHGGLGERWQDDKVVEEKLKVLEEYAALGIRAMHFDFFSTADSYRAHRNVERYFRTSRRLLDYTECHLGMATYGPQFQRLVLLNHPTDLHGFNIAHFSSDWATFLGFRESRREWQKRYDYLMPEYGLYYYLTHYSNWGHPRLYRDPESQQFLYGPHAYCGIAYNFHDFFGFQMSIAAASAFTLFFVLGHLELTMPEPELAFAREYLQWTKKNAWVLRRSRVCMESDDFAVVSKVQDGNGPVFLVNYGPGARRVRIGLENIQTPKSIRLVFPERRLLSLSSRKLELTVPGGSVAILDLNDSLTGPPPAASPGAAIEPSAVRRRDASVEVRFDVPRLDRGASRQALPARLLSLDDLGLSASGILSEEEEKQAGATVKWIGRGRLPARFREVFGFDRGTAPTERFVPWAFADRLWLVYRPPVPIPFAATVPKLVVNGRGGQFFPRVDYRPKQEADWSCPLFFADVTQLVKAGIPNIVRISGIKDEGGFIALMTRRKANR